MEVLHIQEFPKESLVPIEQRTGSDISIDAIGQLHSSQALRPLLGPLCTPDRVRTFRRALTTLLEPKPT
jgi:hypothetical protein